MGAVQVSELLMPTSHEREDLERAAPDGMWIDVMDVRPGMHIAHYVKQEDATLTPAVSLVTAVSADLAPAVPGPREWKVEVHLEGNGKYRARPCAAVRRATAQPDEPTKVGAVVELDTWADCDRYVHDGCGEWFDADGKPHSWQGVCQRGQVHVVVPGMYAIEEAR